MRTALACVAVLVLTVASAAAQVTLQNDGFAGSGQAGVQAGFTAGEIAASRFVPPTPGVKLLRVILFFGGATSQQTVTLHVWDDATGANTPGTELHTADYQVTGSDTALQQIDLTADNITVVNGFRVGIEFQHAGVPSVARDNDGTIAADRNFIMASGLGWQRSQTLGLTGDWIVRAVVAGAGPTPDAGVTPDAAPGGPDAGAGGPDAGTGGACNGNGECAVGTYCDTAVHACTFDCRNADDCGGADCNSLGQCLTGGSGGGCCSTGVSSTGGIVGALGLAAAVALFTTRRRRRP
jgi:MYXO-CTERM domain-containing protein